MTAIANNAKNRLNYKKKILYMVEAFGGGIFTYFVDLTSQLCNDFDIYVAYSVRSQTPLNYIEYFDKRVHLIEVMNFTRSIDPVKDGNAFFEIQRISKEVNPDVIHFHSSKAGALGRWAFNGKKIPLFYTPHGYSFLMQNNGVLKRAIFRAVEILSSKRRCTTISCSQGEHEETLKLTKRAVCINNGINIEELQRVIDKYSEVNEHQFTIFTIGRICYQKNPEQFNAVAEKLPNMRFLWIGDGEMREKLTSPNIKITGWVEREKVLEYSTKADIFILTSLWEGLPISLLEAMYMKKICVVTDVIGNRDVIQNKKNGFICNDVEEFVKVIQSIKAKSDEKLIEKAYLDVLNEYNTNVMGSKYKSIYKEQLQRRAQG